MNRAMGKGSFCSQKFHTPLFFCIDYWLTGAGFKNASIALFPCIGQISCISQLFQSVLSVKPKKHAKLHRTLNTKLMFYLYSHLCVLKPIWHWGFLLSSGLFCLPELFLLRRQNFELCFTAPHLERRKISSALDMDPLTCQATWLTRNESAWNVWSEFAHTCRYMCLSIQVHNGIIHIVPI